MKKPLYIYGAGGLGREICAMTRALNEWNIVAFIDDQLHGTMVMGLPVISAPEVNDLQEPFFVVAAIGNPHVRENALRCIKNQYAQFPVIIHPSAIVLDRSTVSIDAGSIICAGAILTTNIQIGKHVFINLNVSIGHDATIGDLCSIMPGAIISGEVNMNERVFIGSGANIRNRVNLGSDAIVGMGSVVLSDVAQGSKVAGVPARSI